MKLSKLAHFSWKPTSAFITTIKQGQRVVKNSLQQKHPQKLMLTLTIWIGSLMTLKKPASNAHLLFQFEKN